LNTNVLNQSNLHLMDADKIKGFLKLLEENRRKYQKLGNYQKAETAKNRIAQLRNVENEKAEEELKQTFYNHKSHIEDDNIYELDTYKEEWEIKVNKAKEKYKELQSKLHEKYKKEIQDFIQVFDKKYPKVSTSAQIKEVNALKKTLNALLREKNYLKATEIQQKIKELEEKKPVSQEYLKAKK